MIRNYITIAFRSIMRNKAYSAINILGLSVGVACCLLLTLYVQHELSYDQHHDDKENIYRITTTLTRNNEKLDPMGRTSAPIAWGIKEDVPEFETVTRLVNPPSVSLNLITYGEKQFYEADGYIADATLFSIFRYDFTEGAPATALVHPNSVVITDHLAEKIFGNEPALEKVISIAQGGPSADYKVTGVIKDHQRSHLHANFFVSMNSNSQWCDYLRSPNVVNEWAAQNFMLSYVKLRPDHVLDDVKIKMNQSLMKHGAEDLLALGLTKELGLERITDIHLFSETGGETPGITYIYIISSVGAFILLIACINFINLSTARAAKRANEVGLRKTLGAYRSSLIGQFLSEAAVIVLISIVISLIIVQITLPVMGSLTGKDINYNSIDISLVTMGLAAITVVTGLVAGSYPAFYLSSFQPARVLKGKFTYTANSFLRRSLVVFQFVIAIVLVSGVIIVGKQLSFIQNKNLGFDMNQKIVLPLRTAEVQEHTELLGKELRQLSAVREYTATNNIPGSFIFTDFHVYPQGGDMDNAVRFRRSAVEPNYTDVLDIRVIAGRNFHPDKTADVNLNVIVNREGARQLGLTPETILGQTLYSDWQGVNYQYHVIGVMEDYHHASMREAIYPLMFFVPDDASYDYAIVDAETKLLAGTLEDIERVWKQVNPGTPFEYTFLEDHIQQQYEEDRKVSGLIGTFTIIAIVISCLGLYGLSTYMAERRFKEIGVRKVMGASVQQIVAMMSGEFVKLVLVAFVVAIPIAWYGATQWLQDFAYRITPGFELFLLAGAIALLIALITISFESFRAASTNPVNSLRSE